jgi:hypothetical protein
LEKSFGVTAPTILGLQARRAVRSLVGWAMATHPGTEFVLETCIVIDERP